MGYVDKSQLRGRFNVAKYYYKYNKHKRKMKHFLFEGEQDCPADPCTPTPVTRHCSNIPNSYNEECSNN